MAFFFGIGIIRTMSVPYFIHKDDEYNYKKVTELREVVRLKVEQRAKELLVGDTQREAFEADAKALDEFRAEWEAIDALYPVRHKTIFDKFNKEDYCAYFRGIKLEGEFRDKMVDAAYNGMDAIMETLKK